MEEAVPNASDGEGYPIIQEMLALSSALVTCISEQNGMIFSLQDQTLELFEKTGRLIGTLASTPVFAELRQATASLESVFAAVQQTLQQTASAAPAHPQPRGVYYNCEPTAMQGCTPTDALQLMYEATVRDITTTMAQTVQQQAQLGELRMQLLVFTKALLVTVLNSLAASVVEEILTDQEQPQEDPNHGENESWTNSQ